MGLFDRFKKTSKEGVKVSGFTKTPNFSVLEDAYLVRDDPELEKVVNDSLDAIATQGEPGIKMLVDRLFKDMKLRGNTLTVKNFGDYSWNEWLKRRMIVEALGRAKAKSAIPSLVPLLSVQCEEGQFYEILQPTVVRALADSGDPQVIEQLKAVRGSANTSRQAREAIDAMAMNAFERTVDLKIAETEFGTRTPGVYEIGVLFDIDELGGGFYGHAAYRILFENLDPQRATGCTFYDGDTTETLAGRARHYCIAIQSLNAAKISYVKERISACNVPGLLPMNDRFIGGDVTSRHPLVLAAEVDSAGNLLVTQGGMIGSGWVKDTAWRVVEP